MTKGTSKTISFVLRNPTKGALRYQEVDANGRELSGDTEGALIGSLYLRKAKMDGQEPQKITVQVTAG